MESQTIKCKKFYLNIAICVKEKHFSMTFSSKLTMRRRHTGWVMPIWIQSCAISFPQHINEHITTHIQYNTQTHTHTEHSLLRMCSPTTVYLCSVLALLNLQMKLSHLSIHFKMQTHSWQSKRGEKIKFTPEVNLFCLIKKKLKLWYQCKGKKKRCNKSL